VIMNIGPINSNVFNGVQMEPELSPMKTGKARGWLGEYHWVSLAFDPKAADKTNEALAWCQRNFDKSGSRWFEKEKRFYFKDEKDMTVFILKWS